MDVMILGGFLSGMSSSLDLTDVDWTGLSEIAPPSASTFAVTTDGGANAVSDVAIVGSTVELTLTDTVQNDQTVTVTFTTDPSSSNDTNAVQDSAGNDVASLGSTAVTNNSTVAGTAPSFSSAATNADGTKVVLTYNEALSSAARHN